MNKLLFKLALQFIEATTFSIDSTKLDLCAYDRLLVVSTRSVIQCVKHSTKNSSNNLSFVELNKGWKFVSIFQLSCKTYIRNKQKGKLRYSEGVPLW